MRSLRRLATASALAVAVVAAFATPAFANTKSSPHDRARSDHHVHDHERFVRGADHVVFVQTDNPSGNAVVAYDRAHDGTLTLAGTYPTGGNGGVLDGSVVDHLASQGSLTYDDAHALLFAVNAGSNTVSVFAVNGDRLRLRQVVSSYGDFPVSVTVHDNLVYVLNARTGGSVQGYGIFADHLFPLGSSRALGLDASATPEFVNTPGQVAFSPDGSRLIVTTKANGSSIDVFRIGFFGRLSKAVVNAEPGTVPFAVTFDRAGNLVVTEAGTNAVATFALHENGTITLLHAVPTNQAATCWIVGPDGNFYASNAGSASVTRVRSGGAGSLTVLGNTGTDPGSVDAAISSHGRYLYVQTGGSGIVDEFRIDGDGSLTAIGSVTVAQAIGGEGIVAI
jgi:6-phosphogluconolactonase (cycloisomerase 2 family)